jgi:hypothetical protein
MVATPEVSTNMLTKMAYLTLHVNSMLLKTWKRAVDPWIFAKIVEVLLLLKEMMVKKTAGLLTTKSTMLATITLYQELTK